MRWTCGPRRRRGASPISVLCRCWSRTQLGNRSARLSRPYVGHLSHPGRRLAAAHGLLDRSTATRSTRRARLSWIVHLLSYAVALAALFTCMEGSAGAGWITASALLLTVTLFLVLAAQVLAGVQFLRPSGPPGTLPAHIRRLREQSRWRNDSQSSLRAASRG